MKIDWNEFHFHVRVTLPGYKYRFILQFAYNNYSYPDFFNQTVDRQEYEKSGSEKSRVEINKPETSRIRKPVEESEYV